MPYMHPPGDLTAASDIPDMEVIMRLCRGWQYADPPAPSAPVAPRLPLRPPIAGEPAKALALGAALPLPAGKQRKRHG